MASLVSPPSPWREKSWMGQARNRGETTNAAQCFGQQNLYGLDSSRSSYTVFRSVTGETGLLRILLPAGGGELSFGS